MTPKKIARRNPKITTGHTDKADSATTMHRVKLALHSTGATLAPWLMAKMACTLLARRGTIRPGAEHTKVEQIANSVLSPHDSGALPCPNSSRSTLWSAMFSGWVSRIRKVRGVTVCACSTTQPTRYSLNTGPSGFQKFKQELEIMTTSKGQTAPTTKAAPANIHFDPVSAHGEAINALAMAKFYARRSNHAGAARKAVQALAALRKLSAFERVEVAA